MPLIKYKKKTYAGGSMPVLEMTKAQYDALSEAKKNDGTIYLITDGTGGWEAENSVYDNTESGLIATNVQDAVDEVNSKTIYHQITDYGNSTTLEANGAIVHLFTREVEAIANVAGQIIISSENAIYRPKRKTMFPAIVRRKNTGYEIAMATLSTTGVLTLLDNGGNTIPADTTTFDYCIFSVSYALQ